MADNDQIALLRNRISEISGTMMHLSSDVTEVEKQNILELITSHWSSLQDQSIDADARRSLLFLLSIADEQTKDEIYKIGYRAAPSKRQALEVFYKDALAEINKLLSRSDVLSDELQPIIKSMLFSVAALDKEANKAASIDLMTVIKNDTSYLECLKHVNQLNVNFHKRANHSTD